jgi:predicted ATPase
MILLINYLFILICIFYFYLNNIFNNIKYNKFIRKLLMSNKVRVYEVAEEAGATSAEVIASAKKLGIELKSPQSAVSFDDAEEITNFIMTGKSSKIIYKDKKEETPKKINIESNIKNEIQESNSGSHYEKRILTQKEQLKQQRQKIKIVAKGNFLTRTEENKISNVKNISSIKTTKDIILTVSNKKIEDVNISDLNEKREDYIINSFPDITIEIKDLKTIKYLKWNLQKEPGVYAIIGENGSGKSSLLISIAKLIEPQIFHLELTGRDYYENTQITYMINNKKFTWIKNQTTNNNWRQSISDKLNMPKLKGFFESSILTGTRFNKVDEYIRNDLEYRNEDTASDSSDFIKDSMNYILFGKKRDLYKFDKLFKIDAKRKKQTKNKDGKFIYTEKDYSYYALNLKINEYIKEHLFSTGEYFLLQLLKFIDNFKNNKGSIIPAIIIIDEVELSLHPLAQIRLTEKLQLFAKELKLIILFASHSLHILEKINAKNTFFIQIQNDNNHLVSNPIHLGYLTSKLYKHQFFDKVILVEDELARFYVQNTIDDLASSSFLLFGIIIVGGSSQVVKMAIENCHEKFYGEADVMVALDEDKKKDAYGKKQHIKFNYHVPVPRNIEDYIHNLYIKYDSNFIIFIEKMMIKESFNNLDVQTNGSKSTFTTLVVEIAKNIQGRFHYNIDNTKDFVKKEIVKYIYTQLKNSEDHNSFTTEILRLINNERK